MTKKIEFTDSAKEQIEKIINEDKLKKFFRISVKGGGCSGFKYDFSFENKANNEDIIFGKAVIDKTSLDIITGSIIDFKKEMIGEAFVINNPKATASCGCGLSFSV
jgi:iron-sulfur cluster insertion protein